MKKILLFLIMLFGANIVLAQQTYYWTGNTATATLTDAGWTRGSDGSGASRSGNANNGDILIVQNKIVDIQITTNISLKQLQITGGAVVGLINTGITAPSLTLQGDVTTKSLLVNGASTLKIDCNHADGGGTLNVRLGHGGEIEDNSNIYLSDATAPRSVRLGSFRKQYPLTFNTGTSCYVASGAGAFGQNGTIADTPDQTAATSGNSSHTESIVFKSNANLYYKSGGTSPFGNVADGYSILKFEDGSNFYYQFTHNSGFNLLKNRVFGNLIFDTGSSYTASSNGDVFAKASSLTIKQNARLLFSVTNTTPVNSVVEGNVVLEENATLNLNVHTLDLGSNSFTSNSGVTITINNTGGIDGAIQTTVPKTFHENTIYGVLGNTVPTAVLSTSTPTENGAFQIGGIMLGNFRWTLDKNVNILAGGKLYINGGNNSAIELGPHSLTLQLGVEIQRTEHNNSRIWAHQDGTLSVLGINGTKLIPIGTNGVYTPISITTASASDFIVKVASTSIDGSGRPANYVTGTNTITRTNGTGNFTTTLSWPGNWENGDFGTLANNNISLYAYNGSNYAIVPTESADNTANTVTATLSSDGGIFIIGEGLNTLPVTLSSFTAQKQGNSAVIKWATSSEQNNAYFEVQRSVDGQEFTTIGTRKGAGTTSVAQKYSYTDFSPINGANYYRLVQYDNDGKATTYHPEVLNFGFSSGFTVLTTTNSQEVKFKVEAKESGIAKLTLYAVDGRVVSAQNITVNKNNNTYSINIPQLGTGVYVLKYQMDGNVYSAKILR